MVSAGVIPNKYYFSVSTLSLQRSTYGIQRVKFILTWCKNSGCKGHNIRMQLSWRTDKKWAWHLSGHDSSRWRHNGPNCFSNQQHCLLNRLFGCRSTKISELRVSGLCAGKSPEPVNSPHKWPVTRKMFPFDDVIMTLWPIRPFRPKLGIDYFLWILDTSRSMFRSVRVWRLRVASRASHLQVNIVRNVNVPKETYIYIYVCVCV